MKKLELIERISNGEDSYTQFKQQMISSKDLAKEFVAFSNADGGILIFGVDDDENIVGLEKEEIENLGQLVGNVGQENVKTTYSSTYSKYDY
ncbi:MAG: ATP-binding protein [Sulfurovum sp.]|nr:ATP-binding protein [Sulfurovum sp.]